MFTFTFVKNNILHLQTPNSNPFLDLKRLGKKFIQIICFSIVEKISLKPFFFEHLLIPGIIFLRLL